MIKFTNLELSSGTMHAAKSCIAGYISATTRVLTGNLEKPMFIEKGYIADSSLD